MLRRRWVLLLVASFTLVFAGHPVYAQDENGAHTAEQAAQAAVEEWLQHVDAGAWQEAWDMAAPGLRDTVSQEQWRQRGVQARQPLESVRSRRLLRAQYRDTLRQAPNAGPFVLLTYSTTFGTDLFVETVLAVKTDETWRVAGYSMAPMAGRSGWRKAPD